MTHGAAGTTYDQTLAACTYCHHVWRAEPGWVFLECPKCGAIVVRTANPDWD